jgi:hypothetical protein
MFHARVKMANRARFCATFALYIQHDFRNLSELEGFNRAVRIGLEKVDWFPCSLIHMDTKATVLAVLGAFVELLGLLWLGQGLGIVRIRPVLTIANSEEISVRSMQWSIIGAFTVSVGTVIFWTGMGRINR